MSIKFWKKEEKGVELGPQEFYVTDPAQIGELCVLWNGIDPCHRDERSYMSKFWAKAHEFCKFPDRMEIFDPDFCGHFIRFTEDKSEPFGD